MIRIFACLACFAFLIGLSPNAAAHPEDEFCSFDGGLDPALCRALQEMDRSPSNPRSQSQFTETETIDFERPALETAALYVEIGVRHILPGGLDHILFVLALFFTTLRLRSLIWQISAFTVAHTVTLGLVASGVVSPPASVVEPLIAATIVFVAVENIVFRDMTRWRLLVVFIFGLIHGMGFAGFFGSLGLPSGQFWSALIGFNIGVEIGQLTVVLIALIAAWMLRYFIINDQQYRRFVAMPASALIALTALVWVFERVFLA